MFDITMKINWVGPQLSGGSLGIVNHKICSSLKQNPDIHLTSEDPDFTIVHQWPPDWRKPRNGRWICMQPWEYGALPIAWYIPMMYWVDEVWVYSYYNKESYVRSGIEEEKIHIIPLGVDEKVFHPHVQARNLARSDFHFLFVGGTIGRKGIDVLLQAYLNEFTADEDVCLIIKDFGTDSFYKGITFEKVIQKIMSEPNHPRMIYLNHEMSEIELAGLYKGVDCLVHPYRGEGFGLPIVEAMACGIPVIVPDVGPAQDFCNARTAFFVSAREVRIPQKKVGPLETVDYPWWLEISQTELQRVMRYVYQHRDLAKEKGRLASQHVLSNFTWGKSATTVVERLAQISKKGKGDA